MISTVRFPRAILGPAGAVVLAASSAGCDLASTLPWKASETGVRADAVRATAILGVGSGDQSRPPPSAGPVAMPVTMHAASRAAASDRASVALPAPIAALPASDTLGATPAVARPSPDLWTHLVRDLGLPGALSASHHRARRWVRANRRHVHEVLVRSAPYLPYILRAVHRRGLPAEIALIPAVESGYRIDVRSADGAEGLWQFMPGTAASYGLRHSWWYDGRRDVVASTRAALDYLEALNLRFEGNWLVSLAAYNCGEGAMQRALRRAGVKARDADLWAILDDLPPETRIYVPRLLALAELVRAPQRYGIELPRLPAEPPFIPVDTGGQVHIGLAARLAGLDPAMLRRLNPGFLRWATDPAGPYRLVVPVGRAEALREALRALPPDRRMVWDRHPIRAGESLSTIARRYRVPVRELRAANHLSGTLIRAGDTLLVPRSEPLVPAPSASPSAPSPPASTYRVRAGDSLQGIAQRHNVTIEHLLRLNGLTPASVLHPGQTLRVT